MTTCSTPSCGREAAFSLPLKRDKSGKWHTTPICKGCRAALLREARAAGKTIQIYGLDGSEKEAERRNSQAKSLQPFLKEFGRSETALATKLRIAASR